jgi:glycosyltransferase involved in cell wall biosynthesis
MKIVYLGNYNSSENLKGPEKVAKRLFHFMNELNINVVFLEYYFKFYPDFNQFNRLFGKKVINENPKILRLGLINLLLFLKKERPDIIHIVTYQRFIIIYLSIKSFFKSRLVTTMHGLLAYETKKLRNPKSKFGLWKDSLLEQLIIKKSDLLVLLSENHFETASKYYNVSRNKTIIIPNGIDKEYVDCRKKINKIGNRKIIFYNGTVYELKGIDKFFQALKKVKKKDYKIYITGHKPEITINKDGPIEFVGFLDSNSLNNILKEVDIFVSTSKFEPFSLFAVESMAAGLILIVSNKVGMHNYIEHGKNGFIYDFNSPEQLSTLLNYVLFEKHNLDLISNEAKKIYEILRWENVAKKYYTQYERLCKN